MSTRIVVDMERKDGVITGASQGIATAGSMQPSGNTEVLGRFG
jgi:hypothetical protein